MELNVNPALNPTRLLLEYNFEIDAKGDGRPWRHIAVRATAVYGFDETVQTKAIREDVWVEFPEEPKSPSKGKAGEFDEWLEIRAAAIESARRYAPPTIDCSPKFDDDEEDGKEPED